MTLWYLTRGTGVVLLLLLTATILLGIVTTTRWQPKRTPRFLLAGLHRNLTLVAVVLLAVHVLTTVADGYAPIGLKDTVVPFASPYRAVWLGFGTLACDVLLVVVVTSALRRRLGPRTWRAAHWLAYASWPFALLHSLGTGSDARSGWLAALAGGCVAAVVVAVLWRLSVSWRHHPPLRLSAGLVTVALPLALLLWYRSGPLQAGWAARAGTPHTLVAAKAVRAARRVRVVAVSAPTPAGPASSFADELSGTISQSASGGDGLVGVSLDGRARGGYDGRLRVIIRGQPLDDGGVAMTAGGVAFGPEAQPSLYTGRIVALDGTGIVASLRGPRGSLRLVLDLRIDGPAGTLSGSLRGTPATAGPSR